MTFKCSFCGRKFSRSHRAFLSDNFCKRCSHERILASNGEKISGNAKIVLCENGYVTITSFQ
jgi:DNA-directed RNA polymerase subunit RPC12/RpoP